MDSIFRALVVYFFLLVVFRIAGKRSLANITTFDFILLLIVSEAIDNALLGQDYSLIHGVLLILTLIGTDILLSLLKQRIPRLEVILEGRPLLLLWNGELLKNHMDKERVDKEDVLTAAREKQGLERLDQIKYAVLERNGGISIIPRVPKIPHESPQAGTTPAL